MMIEVPGAKSRALNLRRDNEIARMFWLDEELQEDIYKKVSDPTGRPRQINLSTLIEVLIRTHSRAWYKVLHAGWKNGRIAPEVAATAIGGAWIRAGRPEDCLPTSEWLAMFADCGFTIDGIAEERTYYLNPCYVYRASPIEGIRRMSWTPEIGTAELYLKGPAAMIESRHEVQREYPELGKYMDTPVCRTYELGMVRIYRAFIYPEQVLCVIDEDFYGPYVEYVVDTREIPIQDYLTGEFV